MRQRNWTRNFTAVLVMAVSVMGCDALSGRETAGQYIDDTTITSKVISEIIKEPSLSKFQVSVETMQHVVQLSGFVTSAQNVERAGQLARAVEGVWSVKNDLVVR
jgi:hyperosmotically inducible protein